MASQIKITSEDDTVKLAQSLARHLPRCCLVSLDGTLGAGKTRLVRAFAEACDVPASEVTSPTFTLWQTYHGTRTIHHLDAYRVADEDEFDALGFEECLETESVTFVEWANRVAASLPMDHRISIQIEVLTEFERQFTIDTQDATLTKTISAIESSMQS